MEPRDFQGRAPRLPRWLIPLSVLMLTTAVNLQVPLYTAYAAAAHYGSGRTAVAFAAYVFGLLPVLIFLGGLSDRIGRKPVLLAALALSLAATLLMELWPTMAMLLCARVLQGISVGLSMGAATAYLVDLYPADQRFAPAAVTLASALGFGGGALLTSLVLLLHPSLTPPSYGLLVAGLTLVFLSSFYWLPAIPAVGGGLLRPPYFPAGALKLYLAIGLAWSVSGLVIAVVPAALRQHGLQLWSGPLLFLVNGCGAACQFAVGRLGGRRSVALGCALLAPGTLLLWLGTRAGTIGLLLLGASLAGAAGYGLVYRGGLERIVLTAAEKSARAVTGYFLFAYLGFGLPSVLVGYLADSIGTSPAVGSFAVPVAALSLLLSAGLFLEDSRGRPARPARLARKRGES
ncbi:MAG TPA: MFS transporter [Thermoanaerobaculia bacterium]|nr:MFS transporter [Thermoanaerobaculia bacterium]